VRWATKTEQTLSGVLRRADAVAIFENPRHRDICLMTPGDHLGPLISAEVDAKKKHIDELLAEIGKL
jgi:hypothetical protein